MIENLIRVKSFYLIMVKFAKGKYVMCTLFNKNVKNISITFIYTRYLVLVDINWPGYNDWSPISSKWYR